MPIIQIPNITKFRISAEYLHLGSHNSNNNDNANLKKKKNNIIKIKEDIRRKSTTNRTQRHPSHLIKTC